MEKGADEKAIALVLSGGGARGAYEAGVLKYLFGEFPRKAGFVPFFQIYCGTSVGAIHSAFVSSYITQIQKNIKILESIWADIRMEKMLKFDVTNVFKIFLPKHPKSIFDVSFLNTIISSGINWRNIHKNVISRRIKAVCVFATQIATGKTIAFIDSYQLIPEWKKDPFMSFHQVAIQPLHVIASAAIPIVFPPVLIDGRWYCDGGVRLNTPLSPAIRLGAQKIFTVVLRYEVPSDDRTAKLREEIYPNFFYIAGKIMNSIFLDRIAYELNRLEVINSLLEAGVEEFGPEFLERINRKVERVRGYPMRIVKTFVIKPSEDIGKIAAECAKKFAKIPTSRYKMLVKTISSISEEVESDILSYLFFEPIFTRELIALGYEDAKRREEEIYRFFTED